jgi:hypothetical protein
MVIELFTSPKTVGRTNQPRLSQPGGPTPPVTRVAPSSMPGLDQPCTLSNCIFDTSGPCGRFVARIADLDRVSRFLRDFQRLGLLRAVDKHPGRRVAGLAGVAKAALDACRRLRRCRPSAG